MENIIKLETLTAIEKVTKFGQSLMAKIEKNS